jgi:uncharacterized protein YjiS (DUF1127 family)
MATYELHHGPAKAGATLITRIARAVSDLRVHLICWSDTRATRQALSRLSDRELADIGVERSQIEKICAQCAKA